MKQAPVKTNIKNRNVEEALYRLAVGYTTVETRETVEEDASGKVKSKTERIHKEVAPDMKAVLEWLHNRCPEAWADESGQPPLIQLVSAVPRPITHAEDEAVEN